MLNNNIDIEKIDFSKLNGLIPACIQDYESMQILMLGFMNKEALELSLKTKKVHFYSRTRNKLWLKGESSGNYLNLISISSDCDDDSVLIFVKPQGPTCHTGSTSCFKTNALPPLYYLAKLNEIIKNRALEPKENSYTTELFNNGIKRIAQKVGEEGVEVALAAMVNDNDELANETADLFFHILVLLKSKNLKLEEVINCLKNRMK